MVGTHLVNCRLQIGQGLVITNVIASFTYSPFSLGPPVEDPCTLRASKNCLFADRAAEESVGLRQGPQQLCRSKAAFESALL